MSRVGGGGEHVPDKVKSIREVLEARERMGCSANSRTVRRVGVRMMGNIKG